MLRRLTLRGPGRSGELLWDDEAGTFSGTDAAELSRSAGVAPWHPHFPFVNTCPAYDPRALIVLLHVIGWDVPLELADEVRDWLKDHLPSDPSVVY